VPALTTADAAAVLRLSVPAASHTLRRLAAARLLTAVRRGLWALSDALDPLLLLEHVTAPYPAYVSLQSALCLHGLIQQVPVMTYAVSLARSARVSTAAGTYSVHHVAPEFFGGFEVMESGAKLATPEKALVDVFYLSPTKSRLFAALPELELPPRFKVREARRWVARISSARLRTIVRERLERALGQAGSG
jgi:predicted transcriptional regulator of viral defense system